MVNSGNVSVFYLKGINTNGIEHLLTQLSKLFSTIYKQYFKPKGMSPCYMKHLIIAGLFYNVTFVMMKGPNKSI